MSVILFSLDLTQLDPMHTWRCVLTRLIGFQRIIVNNPCQWVISVLLGGFFTKS